ncbi:hypothetical protein A9R05_32745 (plasmid) [Burkholderia sp. KK1]|nr:hypothetical protein A9R05_32745 [Burkholderia sp. KK1]
MTVIALASLIVVAKHTLAVYDVGEPVFVRMSTSRDRLRNPPDIQFNECSGRYFLVYIKNSRGFSVGHFDNTLVCCQILQHLDAADHFPNGRLDASPDSAFAHFVSQARETLID